jgi:hypothetical protein
MLLKRKEVDGQVPGVRCLVGGRWGRAGLGSQESGFRRQKSLGQIANSLCLHLFSATSSVPQARDEILLGLRLRAALLDSSRSWLFAAYLATLETHGMVER